MPLKPDDSRLLQRAPLAERCLLGTSPLVAPMGVPRATVLVPSHPRAILPWLGLEVPYHLPTQWLWRGLKPKYARQPLSLAR